MSPRYVRSLSSLIIELSDSLHEHMSITKKIPDTRVGEESLYN